MKTLKILIAVAAVAALQVACGSEEESRVDVHVEEDVYAPFAADEPAPVRICMDSDNVAAAPFVVTDREGEWEWEAKTTKCRFADPGGYNFIFEDVEGFKTPPAIEKWQVEAGTRITVTGRYIYVDDPDEPESEEVTTPGS